MTMFSRLAKVAAPSILAMSVSAAADLPPGIQFFRGTIVAITPTQVQIRSSAGKVDTITLLPNWNVQVTRPVSPDQIREGSFIGTAEMPQKSGVGRSLEVHVFPPGVKVGEGHYGWGLKKGSMMTNGTVGKVVASPKGRSFDVSYPTGTRHIVVPPKTPIVEIVPGDKSLAKVGARVFVGAGSTPKGLVTTSIEVGANGTAPPM